MDKLKCTFRSQILGTIKKGTHILSIRPQPRGARLKIKNRNIYEVSRFRLTVAYQGCKSESILGTFRGNTPRVD